MEYVLEFEEIFGYENVKEMKRMDNLIINGLPYLNNDPYENIDYYKKSFTEYAKMNVSKYNDDILKSYVSEKIKNYMKELLRNYAWDNYKIAFCLEWYEEDQEEIYLLKYKDYCFDFNSEYSYKITKNNIIKYKPIYECFDELGIEEDDINQIYIYIPNKENHKTVRKELKKLKGKARFMKPSEFKENVLRKDFASYVPDFNMSNDCFFEDVDECELEDYIMLNSSDKDLEIFYKKQMKEKENECIC